MEGVVEGEKNDVFILVLLFFPERVSWASSFYTLVVLLSNIV
jgi:hypothetical protein